MQRLLGLFRTLGPARLAIVGVTTAGLVAGFSWLMLSASTPPMSLLYSELDMSDAARIIGQLDASKTPYQLGSEGTSIFVPRDQVAHLRVTLAEQGVPSGGSMGYELFDRTDALGSTNFLQNVNLVRALEGELARTMRSIATVKSARVHLVIPRRELFSRERGEPSASVLLQMRGLTRLNAAQVAAIQHLIASAVPGLSPDRISIIDGQGTMLTAGGDGGEADPGLNDKADQRRRQLEARLARTIENLIERTVGPGSVRAEVSADMNFDRINTSEEIFDPDGQVVRSTQNVAENNANSEHDGAMPVGVGGNLPGLSVANEVGPASTNTENRNEETVNYEISKKVINHVRETGIVKRLSVAVLVDGNWTTDADGNRAYEPRSDEELEHLATLVRSAVGFDAERGDKVEVVNMRFAQSDLVEQEPVHLPLGLDRSDLFQLAQYLVLLVFGVLVLLLVIRPLVKRALLAMPLAAPVSHSSPLLGATETPPALAAPTEAAGEAQRLPGGHEISGSDEELIDLERVDGRLKASSLKRVGAIVDRTRKRVSRSFAPGFMPIREETADEQ